MIVSMHMYYLVTRNLLAFLTINFTGISGTLQIISC